MKSTTSAIALAACFAPLVFASPMHMLRHAEADVDVKYVTDTAVVTDYAHVTQFVTAGQPEPTTAVTVTTEAAPASSSAAAANGHKNANGDHHWSYSHEQQSSSAPAPPAPAPPAPSTSEVAPAPPSTTQAPAPSTTAAPPTTAAAPSTTAAAPSSQAPAANNPGTNTAGKTYTSAIAAPTPASVVLTGDEAYNPWDGTLQAASLNSTNFWRNEFQAPSVVWNLTLEQQILTRNAPGSDTRCLFQHGGTDGGQNLAEGYDGPTAAIGIWGGEYDPSQYTGPNGAYSGGANHFTQLVWKDTTSMGCAAIQCDGQGGTAFGWFYVCNYWPVGNMGGEYPENILNKKPS